MKFEFYPSKKIRDFKCSDIIGSFVTLTCQHLSDKKDDQYISGNSKVLNDMDLYLSGWIGKVLGKENKQVKKQIKSAFLMEAMNGGRSDYEKYDSYKSYFNKKKKVAVQEYWKAGLFGKIGRGIGDLDQTSLIVVFDDFQIEDYHLWDYKAPEEWYSEMYADEERFKFPKGFYVSAEEAITFFADKPHDDIFGERYFPVLVFPKDVFADPRTIADMAKNKSKPIMTKDHIIFGIRCKPYEYSKVITETYKNSGKVVKAQEWDWE